MRKDFVNEVSRIQRIKRADLIEKDLILHLMLLDLSKDKFFSKNFIFKGGTCLIKYYLGYFRFSEDIDFTWKNQKVFEGKSQKEIRVYLSKIIDELGDIFERLAVKRGLDFKCEKHNKSYVELGGGNKTCTFKIWYQSDILGHRSFVKVQINFVEKLYFVPKRAELKSLLSKEQEELSILFPEYKEYMQRIRFDVYYIREILSEKIRSILTREGVKARDFLDVYLICRKFNIKLEDIHESIVSKTRFMLNLYEKYRRNLAEKKDIVTSGKVFKLGEERGLLLQDIEEKEFYKFLEDFSVFLKKVTEELV
ncbi:MAG: nucleotidyl transferase AbiEii/AbiGii toxin family protein [Euryarchaeota archaeon]|nr:nucleotidyl transferase AbiEii/AbiGii toxin family protein [Euryarchaeota archaeon]